MTTPRLEAILGRPPRPYASAGERQGSINQAVRDAYMLDTSAGQFTLLAASASAFGVPINSLNRRVQPDYSPFDDNLEGYQNFLDEFESSTSPEETNLIKFMIDENMDLRRNLEDYGGWRFATGLLDPINLIPVPFAIGKGFAAGAGQALKRGVPIVAGTELARHAIDPTSTVEETLFAVVGGSLFMGLIGGGVGKIPKTTISVSDALNKLIPPAGTTSMFAGVPMHIGTTGGVFQRMTRALKSAVSNGEPSWKKVNPDDVELRRVDDGLDETDSPSNIIEIHHKEAGLILQAAIRGGDTLQIFDVRVPKEFQRKGIGSYTIRQAVKYAEDNGLRVTSDTQVSADALGMWKGFEEQGFNVHENKNFEVDSKGTRDSTDSQPLFELKQLIDADARQIPLEVREVMDDFKAAADKAAMEQRVLKVAIEEAKAKAKKAPKAGGAKTKAENALKELLEDNKNAGWEERIARSKLADLNVKAAQMLDEATIKDWDLLPTGYNTLLGKLDQFPWWTLMKTPLREVAPDLAVRYQMFALKIASTPGLNNKGNKLSATTGPSVESLSIEYTGKWLVATRAAQKIYRKYAGYGESSGQLKQFIVDSSQRVRSSTNQKFGTGEKLTQTSDGLLTASEFESQISAAIARGGDHEIAEVAEAAAGYTKVLKDMGDEGRSLGVFATQKNIARRIAKIDQDLANFDAKWGKKYQMEPSNLDELEALEKSGVETVMDLPEMPPALANTRNSMALQKLEMEDLAQGYKDADNTNFIHRMWIADEVKAKEVELKEMLTREFEANPKWIFKDKDGNVVPQHPDDIRARVNETYASILRDAETGGNLEFNPKSSDKRAWLEARKQNIEDGTFRDANGALSARTAARMIEIINGKLKRIEEGGAMMGGGGPLVARRLALDDVQLLKSGFIETNVNTWMNHYVQRVAPIIETARVFGDGKAQAHIDELFGDVFERAQLEKDPRKQAILFEEAERGQVAMNDLRDIVHGVYQIPDNPDAITPRVLRMLRNFNILGAMGRSVMMAMGDLGNVVISQGFVRSLGHAVEAFGRGVSDGKIKMMTDEVDLAGSVSEVILGMRYHQMTDFGAAVGSSTKHPRLSRAERTLSNASQRFFLYNLLGPWTDMARRFSGGMLQSRLIENARLWKAGDLNAEEQKIMSRLGINREQAVQFADEWEASGSLSHKKMFIANTEEWVSEDAKRTFRAAMNTEINRMVPTPGAVDKPKALLKSEWWKVIGQYRGFSIAATHRIMGAGLQTKGATKYSGAASMVGIAMMVDALKRPDYIQMPLEQQVLRAVELSAITGIFLDLNDTLERASAGTIGIRPMLGMDIRERNPNWSNRMGVIGAVPNQWLTLMYGLTSDEAETDDLARAIRYMIPYNNLLWWNEAFNRAQRSTVDLIEDTS